jgi:hypothetical protein
MWKTSSSAPRLKPQVWIINRLHIELNSFSGIWKDILHSASNSWKLLEFQVNFKTNLERKYCE